MESIVERTWKNKKTIVSALLIAVIVDLDVFLLAPEYRLVLLPLFVFAVTIFVDTTAFLKKILKTLGEHSTNMWLIHAFYCYYFYPAAKLVYGSGNAVIALAVLVGLSLGSSNILNYFWKNVGKVYGRVREYVRLKENDN